MGGGDSKSSKDKDVDLWSRGGEMREYEKVYPKIFDVSDKVKIAWGGFGEIYKWDDETVLKVIKGNDMQKDA